MSSNLKKAVIALLYDQFDTGVLDEDDDEETFIEHIIQALIEKNEDICPFKNYDACSDCSSNTDKCKNGIEIDCGKGKKEVWKEFIAFSKEVYCA